MGDGQLTALLTAGDGRDDALVIDVAAVDPSSWDEVEAILVDTYQRSRKAMAIQAPIVYVLSGPAVYGHATPLASALAAGLLGGARSLAIEGVRKGVRVHALTLAPDPDLDVAASMIKWMLSDATPSGQVVHCDATHLGRPPA
jgi:hypothetical protein